MRPSRHEAASIVPVLTQTFSQWGIHARGEVMTLLQVVAFLWVSTTTTPREKRYSEAAQQRQMVGTSAVPGLKGVVH